LVRQARSIADQMLSTCRQLEQFKVPRETMKVQNDPAYIVYMLSLMTLNRSIPLLYHNLSAPVSHPFTVYGLLKQIIGELSSFTDRFGCLADLPDGTRLLPDYNHGEAAHCFEKAAGIINMLLRLLVTGPENTIVLERDDAGGYSATIPLEAFENVAKYYLVIRTAENRERLFLAMRNIIKISSRESVAHLIARALPGLPVNFMEVPPPGIARRADSYCFHLDHTNELWFEIQRNRSICLYWDKAPADVRVEMVIMRS
jgi:type VI secretion system protein ImpJ